MAQKVLVQLVDDLTGEASDDISTVLFGLDGANYEIDLTEENAERLRATLAEYVGSARRTGGRVKRGTRPSTGGGANGEAGQVREWAAENGFELSARGRIPGHVLDAYKEAQSAEKPAKRRSRKKA
ncbi:histone-like nucleoid-structuring protein Lsr2 [Actinophytocola gossypii]|uniref:Lsr2 family protein n=1 Tax=Actinophytocola gossypii TaxID=2812003 RepID=A0ABT2JCA3_9PSEU|nr:Lsr2 family protein [Actinophytocola gossypii]MCT2585501.1 Lsr2 family protein [Actinophytocola gossypii]